MAAFPELSYDELKLDGQQAESKYKSKQECSIRKKADMGQIR